MLVDRKAAKRELLKVDSMAAQMVEATDAKKVGLMVALKVVSKVTNSVVRLAKWRVDVTAA